MHNLADPTVAPAAVAALVRMLAQPDLGIGALAQLRAHAVTIVLAADLAIAAGAILEDGTDDALLAAADAIARLVDPGAG
jgi:hypothetical protein